LRTFRPGEITTNIKPRVGSSALQAEWPLIMRPPVCGAGWSVMMTMTNKLYARTSALPAIAAALALSSTPVLAQDAQPAPTEPAPATTAPAAPATDPLAPTPDATAPATDTSTTTKTATPTVKRTARTHVTAAKAAPAAAHAATRPAPTHSAAPAAAAAATPAPSAPPQPTAAPAVDLTAKPAPVAAAPAKQADNTLPYAAGGALALMALGGTAAAVANRRRRRREQEQADQESMSFEPFEAAAAQEPKPAPAIHREQPAIAATSAFAWGNRAQAKEEPHAKETMSDRDDRRPGETWVERAYRGPTPNNPSVSLRNRLSRAAFFDKREREAAAGLAEPVEGNAGLPKAMTDEQERELA